jgi:hypothetical protein
LDYFQNKHLPYNNRNFQKYLFDYSNTKIHHIPLGDVLKKLIYYYNKFEYEGEIDLYKLDAFLKETNYEYDGDLREYFKGKEYKWKLID